MKTHISHPNGGALPTRPKEKKKSGLTLNGEVAKRKQLEDHLRHAQKMEAVGQLAGSVAHDFNNILISILSGLGMLRKTSELSAETREALKGIERETARGANLARQLLLFSRQEAARIEALDLNELISDLLSMLGQLLGENIEISFRRPSDALWVNADAGMLGQVVMTLCLNARDAMPAGGRLTIAADAIDPTSEAERRSNSDRPGDRFVCLSISDTRCGMAESVLSKIFEPFFTTKEAGKGKGLGLATVHGIVQQHHGWVEVESDVGRGTTFRVFIPERKRREAAKTRNFAEDVKGGSEVILLVEDEISVRRLVAAWLRKLGYTVLEAGNGLEALEVWDRSLRQIDLLFTDIMMPGNMTGLDLAVRLMKENPLLKTVSSSGYVTNLAEAPLSLGKRIVNMPKPYAPDALALTVRRCLDGAHITDWASR